MTMYDEQPDGDPHGACRHEIARLQARLAEPKAKVEPMVFLPIVVRLRTVISRGDCAGCDDLAGIVEDLLEALVAQEARSLL